MQLAGGAGEASWAPAGGDASQREHPTPNGVQGGESCSREHRARRQQTRHPWSLHVGTEPATETAGGLVPLRGVVRRSPTRGSPGPAAAPSRLGVQPPTRMAKSGDQAHRTKSQRSKMSRGRRNVTSISGLRRVCYEDALTFQIARWGSSQPSVQLPRGRPGGGRGGGRRRSRRQVPVCREPCGLSLGAHA